MASMQRAFARGLLIGAAGVAVWAVSRRANGNGRPMLLDWGWASRVAERVSGEERLIGPAEKAKLLAEYRALVERVEQPLQTYTGTVLPLSETSVQVMDRADWIRANVTNFRDLFEPVEAAYARSVLEGGLQALLISSVTQVVLSGQFGLLLGYLARRVLGQYDVSLLGKEPVTAGKLYFVEPNIRALVQRMHAPADEVRQWIVLHEATHAHEFEVHPWVRGYLNDHLREYLRSVVDDMVHTSNGGFATFALRLADNLRRGHNLLNALMTPRQREIVSRLQALMSLAEGYSNHVMNAVGRQTLPHFDQISRSLERRQRSRGKIEELFLKITGLKMKMEQYKLGEAFVDRVVESRWVAFLNRAWEAPHCLPSEAEIRQPEHWIARMDAPFAANGVSKAALG